MAIRLYSIRSNSPFTFYIGYGVLIITSHNIGYSGIYSMAAFENSWISANQALKDRVTISHPYEYATTISSTVNLNVLVLCS